MTQTKHILVVEDVAVNREIAKLLLNDLGYQVSTANNGQEAIDFVNDNRVALIFMDLIMPVMDGYEATRTIKNMGNMVAIPIIAMSGETLEKCGADIQAAGFDDHLHKPIDPDSLRAMCHKYLAD